MARRPGQVTLGARKVSVRGPRGRYVDGGEVELDTWETFASEDLLRQVVVEPDARQCRHSPSRRRR